MELSVFANKLFIDSSALKAAKHIYYVYRIVKNFLVAI